MKVWLNPKMSLVSYTVWTVTCMY